MRARAQESHDRVAALEQRQREIEEMLDARRTYGSEGAFRAALNARIRDIARRSGVDGAEVARRFALQQFVSRLFDRDPESWLVTGGDCAAVPDGGGAGDGGSGLGGDTWGGGPDRGVDGGVAPTCR